MNDKLLKQYHIALKRISEQYGFIKHNETYYRIINDIKQSFSIERINIVPKIRDYRVTFGIIPLSQRINSYSQGEDYYLKMFLMDQIADDMYMRLDNDKDSWRCFNSNNITAITNEIFNCISNALINIFSNCESADKAFYEIDKLRLMKEEYRKRYLKYNNIPDKYIYTAGEYTITRLYLALKSQNYTYAYSYYNYILCTMQNSCINIKQQIISEGVEESNIQVLINNYEELQQKCDRVKEYIKQLENGNYVFFDKMIEENEAFSRQQLHLHK